MVRRTVYLPDSIDELVRRAGEDGESYSATVTRLIEVGAHATGQDDLDWIGSWEGPEDASSRVEESLRESFSSE